MRPEHAADHSMPRASPEDAKPLLLPMAPAPPPPPAPRKLRVVIGIGALALVVVLAGLGLNTLGEAAARVWNLDASTLLRTGPPNIEVRMTGAPGGAPTEPASPPALGEAVQRLAAIDSAAGRVAERGLRIGQAFEHRLRQLDLDTVLDPVRLDSAEDIADSRRRIAAARGALDRLIAHRAALQRQAPGLLAQGAATPQEATTAVTAYNLRAIRLDPAIRKHDAYHEAYLDSMGAVLDICERELGESVAMGGALRLASETAARAYELETARIGEVERRLGRLIDRLGHARGDALDALERGVLPPTEQVVPGRTLDTLTISKRRVVFKADGRRPADLGAGDSLAKLAEALGAPDRSAPDGDNRMHYWDTLGLAARTLDGERVIWLAVTLNSFGESAGGRPRREFLGRVRLYGQEIGEVDTPQSLNRRFGRDVFSPVSSEWLIWATEAEGFTVYMPLSPTGLAYGVSVFPQ